MRTIRLAGAAAAEEAAAQRGADAGGRRLLRGRPGGGGKQRRLRAALPDQVEPGYAAQDLRPDLLWQRQECAVKWLSAPRCASLPGNQL